MLYIYIDITVVKLLSHISQLDLNIQTNFEIRRNQQANCITNEAATSNDSGTESIFKSKIVERWKNYDAKKEKKAYTAARVVLASFADDFERLLD